MSAIAAWLDRLGLSRYTPVFVDNDVDFEVLPRLSEDDLRELGIPLGARKKILLAVAEIREQGATVPASPLHGHDAAAGAGPERRQITVMFADVVGSTSLAEQLDVEDLRLLLLAYQQECATAIERYGGYVAQYLGDGVLAYFGYPQAHEDDAVRAVRAALAIIDQMRATNARILSEHGVGLEIRVGVNTGLVVAGQVGAGATREQLAVGETPNVAARLQGVAEPGTVVVSEATWRLTEGFFTAQPLGPQSLKGARRPTPAYRIVAPTAAANRFEASLGRSLTPLVSRDVELGFLQQRWEQADDGEGQAVLLQGEAGIGKSRLVRTFRERLALDDHQAITLNCSSHHQASAFYPVVEQLRRTLAFTPNETPGVRQEKLGAFIGRLRLPADRLAPPLAALLGIGTDNTASPASADPAQLRRDTLDAFFQIVAALSRERPLFFVVEDVHWIDPSTQELIGYLLGGIQALRVMVVLTARPEYRAPWVGLTHFSTLSLSRLSRRETEAMIHRVASAELPPEVLSDLVARSDGVPLFIEELTKSVLDAHGESPGSVVSVPATLQQALAARLDRLAPIREVIQVAALLGRVFDVDIVQAATGLNRNELEESLANLTEVGLIYGRPQLLGQRFEFKHALIQEVALNTLVRQRRVLLHGRLANALENIRPELALRQPEILAHHLQEAGDDRRAWVLWRAAGDLAAQTSASREAVTHFTHATECLKRLEPGAASNEEEARIYLGLSSALMRADGYRSDRLAHALDSAQRSARASGSASLQWRVALQAAPLFYSMGRNGQYLSTVEELSNRAPIDNPWMRAWLLTTRGIARFNRGEYTEAERHLQAAIDLVADLPGHDTVRIGEGDLSVVARGYAIYCVARLGRLNEALQAGLAVEHIGRSLGDPFSFAWALLNRCASYSLVGNHEAALADAEDIIAISRKHGFTARLGNGLMRLGAARAHLGELEQGIETFREGRAIWRASGVVFHAPQHAAELADLLLMAGAADEAHLLLEDVDTLVAGTDEAACLAECQRVRGMIAAANGDVASAERWLEAAIATAQGQGAALFELRATTRLADLLAAQGRQADAARRLGAIYATFTEGHQAPDLQDAKALLDRLRT